MAPKEKKFRSWQQRARHQDVVLISHPRCGLTWVRFLFHEIRKRVHPEELLKDSRQERNPLVRQDHDLMGLGTCKNRSWFQEPHLFLKYKGAHGKKWEKYRVIFLTRDPRDALVSNWYRICQRDRADVRYAGREYTLDDFVRDPAWGIEIFCLWLNWWAEYRNEVHAFLWTSYETLWQVPEIALRDMLRFIGISCERSVIREAIEASSFEKMKKAEQDRGTLFKDLRPGYKERPETMIVRKGGCGGWKEEMSEETQAFCLRHLKTLVEPFACYYRSQ